MESDFAALSLDDDDEEILQAEGEIELVSEEEALSLVGCFLTASIIHFPPMKSTMANLWHPIKGIQIRDLGGKRYIFKFFLIMDMERVIKGSPWTFNNHLLILHKLQWGEDPLRIPLILSPFWVQVHDVPIGFYSESLAMQLGNFIGIFQEYNSSSLGKENMNYMQIRVHIDIRRPLKRKKQVQFKNKCSYVRFKYERLTLFCFFCGRLGHNNSYCEVKMQTGYEIEEMGWDFSLRAQSRRAQAMSSAWLREEGGPLGRSSREEFRSNEDWRKARKFENIPDPILGFNLEGNGLK
ncbi:uncharacterized protein LOC128036167 [Gossypium raimondii]|uniref:uncharacterized protein LOC128036167 n=1 Tax=Gossypium raimondii TaxID=29730 RepID=UPI00227D1798|nr:uncharacterized protein LOC128036167 [Gossypium raimondii]